MSWPLEAEKISLCSLASTLTGSRFWSSRWPARSMGLAESWRQHNSAKATPPSETADCFRLSRRWGAVALRLAAGAGGDLINWAADLSMPWLVKGLVFFVI